MDLAKASRLCLLEQEFDGLKSISSSNSENISYIEMINYCTGLNVQPSDAYPKSICLVCDDLLLKLYHFKKQNTIANARLERMIFVKENNDMDAGSKSENELKVQNNYLLNMKLVDLSKSDIIKEECQPNDHYWNNITEMHFNNDLEIEKQFCSKSNLAKEDGTLNNVELISSKVETANIDRKSLNKRKYKKPSKKNFRELCLVCGKLINNLSAHAKTHMNPEDRPKKHICTICNKGFCIKNNLTTHMRKHTDEKRYECEYCGKKFRVWSTRLHHIYREHTGQFRFTCHICDKKFIQMGSYNSHLLRHTGEKPEKCEICDKTFVTKDILKNHQVSHISEKNHMCEICHKLYKSLKSLREHMKIHNDERNYNCPVCSQAFIQNHVLRTYVKKKHPEYELPPPGTIVSQKALRRQQEELAKKNLWIKIPNNDLLVDRDKSL